MSGSIDELRRAREELQRSARELRERRDDLVARLSELGAEAPPAPRAPVSPRPTRPPAGVIATLVVPEQRSIPVGRRDSARISSTSGLVS